ncbi:MAG: GNAT family N-acetyltransferase [Armatimonadota bacterium]|nr:GNAT family N-acetyltransferase [Armatimonadota bacterium]
MADGPRSVQPAEFDSLMDLVDTVFKGGQPGTMLAEYPHLFNADNVQNLHVIAEDGKIVSHVGTTIQNAVFLGCSLRVGNVGAVSTHPDYRGRGYAGGCFQHACSEAHAQGVDLMLISGDRRLYRDAGCRPVGLDKEFTITRSAAGALNTSAGSEAISVERFSQEHLPAIRRLYENEPVRYLRPLEEWQMVIREEKTTQHNSRLWVVRRNGNIAAYAGMYPPRQNRTAVIEEFAGDRSALIGGLYELMNLNELDALDIHVQSYDLALLSFLGSLGKGRAVPASGTQLLINFPQMMGRLRPLMEERIGTAEASKLSFTADNDQYVFAYEGDPVVTTSRAGAIQLIFGAQEPPEWEWSTDGGASVRGQEALRGIFPIPALVYGFSYV